MKSLNYLQEEVKSYILTKAKTSFGKRTANYLALRFEHQEYLYAALNDCGVTPQDANAFTDKIFSEENLKNHFTDKVIQAFKDAKSRKNPAMSEHGLNRSVVSVKQMQESCTILAAAEASKRGTPAKMVAGEVRG